MTNQTDALETALDLAKTEGASSLVEYFEQHLGRVKRDLRRDQTDWNLVRGSLIYLRGEADEAEYHEVLAALNRLEAKYGA